MQIGYIVQMNEAEVIAMRQWAVQNGAKSAVVRTGEMVNSDWAIDLGRRAQSGRTYLGGAVKDVSKGGIPQFEIHFEKID